MPYHAIFRSMAHPMIGKNKPSYLYYSSVWCDNTGTIPAPLFPSLEFPITNRQPGTFAQLQIDRSPPRDMILTPPTR